MSSDRATSIDGADGGAVSSPRLRRGRGFQPENQRQDAAATMRGEGTAPPAREATNWLMGFLQASDSFYPTGSYAHSFGLEGLVHANAVRDRDTLREFIFRSALPSLRHVELPLAAHAWRGFGENDWNRVAELCVLSSALKSAREARLASENIGRQRAELAANLHAAELAREFLTRAAAGNWPHSSAVSAALEGRVLGAPLDAVLATVCYANLASLLSAAMKLLRLGQNAAQSLLTESLSATPPLIAAAQSTPLEEIGWFNPWLDIAAARHAHADSRMFIS